jgi:ADP-ribose/FAD diphosphatase
VIHYQNPKMIVGCIIEHHGRVLLCKRAIEPRRGYWTVPAGFLELGESAMAGALRETREEACARVRIIAPYAHFDVPHIGQAYIIYRASLLDLDFAPGTESLEVKLVGLSEIPWSEIAFPVVRHSLELLSEDLDKGAFRSHQGALVREEGRYVLRDHLAVTLG